MRKTSGRRCKAGALTSDNAGDARVANAREWEACPCPGTGRTSKHASNASVAYANATEKEYLLIMPKADHARTHTP